MEGRKRERKDFLSGDERRRKENEMRKEVTGRWWITKEKFQIS